MPGAVIYAKDLAGMQAFYERVTKLAVTEVGDGYVLMEGLSLVALPEEIADTFEVASPPVRREETAVKLVFDVSGLAAARVRATQLGGLIDPAETEWVFGGFRVCDGHDPEGNVVQLREPLSD